ncbi:MAG: nreC [Chthoniobacter sp.]|jgi:DNA-binding NarL/FixJ family response regulator|nr:nreC [Chthoniobacter sp.]
MKKRVVIADEHAAVRQMLALLLSSGGAYEVVAEARTGYEALKACRQFAPRLLICDLLLPELSGVELLRIVRAELRETKVLVFSGTLNRQLIFSALEIRPHAFVQKQDSLATLQDALRAVEAGCSYLTPLATGALDEARIHGGKWPTLTGRQRAVLQMVAEGMSSKEMASRLGIATKTIEHYRAQVMERLDLHDVAGLTRYAVRAGFVSLES